jgi:hypothetical protein
MARHDRQETLDPDIYSRMQRELAERVRKWKEDPEIKAAVNDLGFQAELSEWEVTLGIQGFFPLPLKARSDEVLRLQYDYTTRTLHRLDDHWLYGHPLRIINKRTGQGTRSHDAGTVATIIGAFAGTVGTLAAIVSVYYSRKGASRRPEDEELGRMPEREEVRWLSRTCADCMRCGLCGRPLPERSGIEELRGLSPWCITRCTRCGSAIPERPLEPLTEVEWLPPILPPVPPAVTSEGEELFRWQPVHRLCLECLPGPSGPGEISSQSSTSGSFLTARTS